VSLDDEPEPTSSRALLAAGCVLVLLVGLGLWLSGVLGAANTIQDCVASGRTNCAPVDTQGH
jgi:hypothetical protein